MTTPTILDIVKRAIAESGADGLSNNDQECGCEKDDLAPCGYFRDDCKLAKKRELHPGEEWDFLMIPLDRVAKYDEEHKEDNK